MESQRTVKYHEAQQHIQFQEDPELEGEKGDI